MGFVTNLNTSAAGCPKQLRFAFFMAKFSLVCGFLQIARVVQYEVSVISDFYDKIFDYE
jgi:hypothetical protein